MLNTLIGQKIVHSVNRTGCWLALLSLVCTIGFSTPCLAAVYKWVDAEGTVHYGSQRPDDAQAERLKVDIKPKYPTNAEQEQTEAGAKGDKSAKEGDNKGQKKDGENDGKKDEKKEAAKPKVEEPPKMSKKEKSRLCKSARDRLQNLQSHSRIRESDGSMQPEEERQRRIKATKKSIREYCR